MSPSPSIPFQSRSPEILRAQGIRKSYRMGDSTLIVLRHVDLAVKEGEFVAIEGRSGSGKSTLLHLLGALDTPDAGVIEYRQCDIGAFAPRQRSRLRSSEFGFVFQFYHLLPELNVLENTMLPAMVEQSWLAFFGPAAHLRAKAAALLDQLGLAHRMKHKPAQLSGGERQRVAIARALMNDPKVLYADEPTGNLDAETGRQIMGLLEKLHRERDQTIVMVTHDRALAAEADRVLVLRDGKLGDARA